MGKGDRTREKIIEQAAELFNCQGYFGASMSDIMRVTGLNKGGIYNHFESKERLAVESFDYAIDLVGRRMSLAIENATNAADKLVAIISVIGNLGEDKPLPGGCPLLNTAVESDDANPVLRERARLAMTRWRNRIRRITKEGIKAGEIKSSVDGDILATILIATLEGAVMMSMLYDNPVHIRRAVGHLKQYIETAVRAR
ncbi:MAG: TetR/AcrR family transcriptional regulator, transcriptional repressor for nem operon [Blastocatellia bacterium]|nr:TetR/AcrR family transcriptional regulator, transcriptional repressor for nem operon [Blastocatellia bacterium]